MLLWIRCTIMKLFDFFAALCYANPGTPPNLTVASHSNMQYQIPHVVREFNTCSSSLRCHLFRRDESHLHRVFHSRYVLSCRSLSVTYSSEASVTRRHLRCHVTLYQTTNLALEFQPLRSPIRTYAQTSFDAVVLMDTRKAYTQFAIPCCLK